MKLSKLQSILICVSAISLVTGCSSITGTDNVMSTNSTKYTATNPNNVKLYYSSSSMPKHYKVIGRASVDDYSFFGATYSQQTIADELRRQAASIGGNGVINITTGLEQTTGDIIIRR